MKKTNKSHSLIMEFPTVVFLLTLVITANPLYQEGVMFPSEAVHWKAGEISDLVCPPFAIMPDFKKFGSVTAWLPTITHDVSVPGYICQARVLITKCYKGFFGGWDLETINEDVQISDTECVDAIKTYLAGNQKIADYPQPDCHWMASSIASNQIISVTPTPSVYDPYKNGVVHSALMYSICTDPPCQTKKTGSKFYYDKTNVPYCQKMYNLHRTTLHYDFTNGSVHGITSIDQYYPGNIKCTMKYCGMDGFKTTNGIWFGLDGNSSFKEAVSTAGQCDLHELVKEQADDSFAYSLDDKLVDRIKRDTCANTLMKVIESGKLTRSELMAFQPGHPGVHPVFRLNEGVLEVGSVRYQAMTIRRDETTLQKLLGFPSLGGPVGVSGNFIKSIMRGHIVLDGPNGAFILNDTLYSTPTSLSRLSSDIGVELNNSIIIHQDIVRDADEVSPLNDTEIVLPNDIKVIPFHWPSLTFGLGGSVTIMLGVFIAYMMIKNCRRPHDPFVVSFKA